MLKGANPDTQIGVMAQEIEKYFPSMVSEVKGYKSVAYDKLAVVSLEAVKELNAVVEDQQRQLEALKMNSQKEILNLKAKNEQLTALVAEAQLSREAYAQLAQEVKVLQKIAGLTKQTTEAATAAR